ncbi:predicted protein [Nematostella vectensis]|uniref:VWFA domain-containing protein n=1 Tax=Nematostella vectensis TaxID=45351 RepID=A7SD04_NEMVE|nr:predicted protein [Nematostella vectensis]|eukprot:XP_001630490.1 predicted protein [Nematostella vectensis]
MSDDESQTDPPDELIPLMDLGQGKVQHIDDEPFREIPLMGEGQGRVQHIDDEPFREVDEAQCQSWIVKEFTVHEPLPYYSERAIANQEPECRMSEEYYLESAIAEQNEATPSANDEFTVSNLEISIKVYNVQSLCNIVEAEINEATPSANDEFTVSNLEISIKVYNVQSLCNIVEAEIVSYGYGRRSDEKTFDKVLASEDIDQISDAVTPYGLGNCRTNCLEKAMEVSSLLHEYAERNGPSADEFRKLSGSVQDFAVQLIDPLKGDDVKRSIFGGDDFDRVADKAILCQQKKFVSHPVIYTLLMRKWIGRFSRLRQAPFLSYDWLIWVLINMLIPLDMVLFPFIFAVMYLIHKILKFIKRNNGYHVLFLLKPTSKDKLSVMKEAMEEIMQNNNLTMNVTHAAVLQAADHKPVPFESLNEKDVVESMNFNPPATGDIAIQQSEITETPKKRQVTCVGSSLTTAKEMLTRAGIEKKVLVLLTDDKLGESKEKLSHTGHTFSSDHITMVAIGIGTHPDIKELEAIATCDENVVLFPDFNVKDVGEKISKTIYGHDCFDRYMDYFTTPYFVFARDTCSYLVLLALHFLVCLQLSSQAFTVVEWLILVFFVGRLLNEAHQLISTKPGENNETSPNEDDSPKPDSRKKNERVDTLRKYLSDRWNILDLLTLLSYVIILILRVITWASRAKVSQNRLLAVAGYLYGLNAMLLTLRVFGHMMESKKSTGAIQIALFQIIGAVVAIFGQFLAATVAFSLAITKIYMVEVSYATPSSNASHGFCSKPGLNCWWGAVRHLSWSLLGLADTSSLDSSDGFSEGLAKVLYGLFLIMGVVMLMNMMIALLSNTYQQVEDNSFYEWSYKKAITIRTYSGYHPVPVPFNIVSLFVLLVGYLWKSCRQRCCYAVYEKRGSANQSELKKPEKVEPVSIEEKKRKGPRAWDSVGIRIDGNQLMYLGPDSCICSLDKPEVHHGARYERYLTRDFPGFEVLIQDCDENRSLAVGLVSRGYNLHLFPGWQSNTVGYHVDDGKVFDHKDSKFGRVEDAAMAHRGDLIGCFADFDNKKDGTLPVVFSLNGRVVGRGYLKVDEFRDNSFYPYVGMGNNVTVIVKVVKMMVESE